MSGAWEIVRPSVLVAVLTREVVTTSWAFGFRNLQLPPGGAVADPISGAPFDNARNMACENALRHGFEWLFFLDDDVVCPPDTILRLMPKGADIISGLYYRRNPPIVPVAMTLSGGQARWVESWNPPGSTVEVDYVGAGCLLIHRRVLERMGGGWFKWEIGNSDPILAGVPEDRQPGRVSEDFSFARKAKTYGFRIYLDTSIVCQHFGTGRSQGDASGKGEFVPGGAR